MKKFTLKVKSTLIKNLIQRLYIGIKKKGLLKTTIPQLILKFKLIPRISIIRLLCGIILIIILIIILKVSGLSFFPLIFSFFFILISLFYVLKISYIRKKELNKFIKSYEIKNKIIIIITTIIAVISSANLTSKFTFSTTTQIIDCGLFGPFSDFIVKYREFLSHLSSEELACITNLLGFLMIFGGMTSITSILFGEYILNYFKLESKWPKLAKYIKLKQKVNKYYLIFNFFMVYLIIFAFVIINLFMFLSYNP